MSWRLEEVDVVCGDGRTHHDHPVVYDYLPVT